MKIYHSFNEFIKIWRLHISLNFRKLKGEMKMVKQIKGNILNAKENFIVHQVNCKGIMGSGVAKQIRDKYPKVYNVYKEWCDDKHINFVNGNKSNLLGQIQVVRIDDNTNLEAVINIFAQDGFGYKKCYTDYDALKECLKKVNKHCKGKSVALPYKIGCGRGGGDWDAVLKIIKQTLVDCDVVLYEFEE
jgi:O-acetyl-ADP-ribose deacetylase (regulator of RNase III)